MYKIMTKLHTTADNIFAFYMIKNDNDALVEYSVNTTEEAAKQAMELLKEVGYSDLRIIDDQSYYLDLIYGKKPEPAENLYVLSFVEKEGVIITPNKITDIKENSTVQVDIEFTEPVESFHLIIDEKEYKTGLPNWIKYEDLEEQKGILYFTGITRDHLIEIVID